MNGFSCDFVYVLILSLFGHLIKLFNKMNNKQYHTVGTILKSNINILDRDEIF